MTPLVAVDLDQTLITIDSFRLFVRRHLDVPLAALLAARALRLLDRASFAERATRRLAPFLADRPVVEAFAAELERYVSADVLARVKAAEPAAKVVVLSASPQEYVGPFAARLGFEGVGSHREGPRYVHCYGARKLEVLRSRYPEDRYSYDLALADRPSDRTLLAAFKQSVWVR